MINYLATPFHGDKYDEDPAEFLCQHMGSADNNIKARHFIYYLQADSFADEWFKSWRKRKRVVGNSDWKLG
jgi:hypothetical protein